MAGAPADWRDLWQELVHREPFAHPEWVHAYLRCFEPDVRLVWLESRVGSRLDALIPLIREARVYDGLPARVLRVPMNDHCFRCGLLARGTDRDDGGAERLWAAIAGQTGWDLFCVPKYAVGGAFDDVARRARSAGYPVLTRPAGGTRFVPLANDGPAAQRPWLDTIDASLKRRLRKTSRLIQESLGAAPLLEHCEAADAAQLERFYAIEGSGWKGREGTAILCSAATRAFYDTVAETMATDRALVLHFLTVQDVTLAAAFSVRLDDRLFVLKFSYDEKYAKYGPGNLLSSDVLRDSWERGIREVDFGPDAEYKQAWTPHVQEHQSLYLFNRSAYGTLLYAYRARLRPWLGGLIRRRRGTTAEP